MKTLRTCSLTLLATALALAPLCSARADESTSQIAFSDPSKPGTLKVRVWHGDLTVRGADVKEVTVKSDSTAIVPTPRKDGLRVLSASSSFQLSEKDNVVTLEYGGEGWSGGSADFDITVPRSTSVVVSNSAHGDLACTGVSGDVDVRTMSGDVNLEDISGGALVETMNGEINVGVKSLAQSKPLSFSSMHGQITIHVPSETKANVCFRTHRGVIMTNFDDKALVAKTTVTRVTRHKVRSADAKAAKAAKGAAEAAHSVGPAEAPEAPEVEAPEQPEQPEQPERWEKREGSDWHQDVRDSIKEAAEAAAMAGQDAAAAVHEALMEVNVQFSGVIPPLPPMTGGKVVTGTLNGGGTQIQASTLNGDITLKRVE